VTLLPIKKRINTELLIDKRAALYTQKGAGKNNSKREKGKILGAKGQ